MSDTSTICDVFYIVVEHTKALSALEQVRLSLPLSIDSLY